MRLPSVLMTAERMSDGWANVFVGTIGSAQIVTLPSAPLVNNCAPPGLYETLVTEPLWACVWNIGLPSGPQRITWPVAVPAAVVAVFPVPDRPTAVTAFGEVSVFCTWPLSVLNTRTFLSALPVTTVAPSADIAKTRTVSWCPASGLEVTGGSCQIFTEPSEAAVYAAFAERASACTGVACAPTIATTWPVAGFQNRSVPSTPHDASSGALAA